MDIEKIQISLNVSFSTDFYFYRMPSFIREKPQANYFDKLFFSLLLDRMFLFEMLS